MITTVRTLYEKSILDVSDDLKMDYEQYSAYEYNSNNIDMQSKIPVIKYFNSNQHLFATSYEKQIINIFSYPLSSSVNTITQIKHNPKEFYALTEFGKMFVYMYHQLLKKYNISYDELLINFYKEKYPTLWNETVETEEENILPRRLLDLSYCLTFPYYARPNKENPVVFGQYLIDNVFYSTVIFPIEKNNTDLYVSPQTLFNIYKVFAFLDDFIVDDFNKITINEYMCVDQLISNKVYQLFGVDRDNTVSDIKRQSDKISSFIQAELCDNSLEILNKWNLPITFHYDNLLFFMTNYLIKQKMSSVNMLLKFFQEDEQLPFNSNDILNFLFFGTEKLSQDKKILHL